MKLSLLLSLLLAASVAANPFAPAQSKNTKKAEFISRLLRRSTPVRQLADANVDLTSYSVSFKKCQFVKTYNDNLAYSGSATVLAVKRFVIFRLCPTSYCKSCSSNYGEYILDLYDYLEATVTYQKTSQTNNCTACSTNCASYAADDKVTANEAVGDDAAVADEGAGRYLSSTYTQNFCKSCLNECEFIDALGSNGYYDATDFIKCTKVYDDGSTVLYAGPVCANSGGKIKIGVFTDDNCYSVDTSKDPDNYVKNGDTSMKLSYHLMKDTYPTCISCAYTDGDGVTATSEFCTTLYDDSAKCEKPTSFSAGVDNSNGDAVQAEDDTLVCNYISSLSAGTYSETGEINISGASSTVHGGAKTSGGQKFALTFFILGTVGLAVYAAMLHSKLTKGGKADLSNSAGAMA